MTLTYIMWWGRSINSSQFFRNRKLVEYQDALNGQCTHYNIIRSIVNTNPVEVGGVAKALQLHSFRDGGVATFARPAKFMIEDSIFLLRSTVCSRLYLIHVVCMYPQILFP
jgi:hypothetical protein